MSSIIPTKQQREVNISGQSGGYLNVRASPEAFGAAQGRALQSVAQGLGSIASAFDHLEDVRNETTLLDNFNQAKNEAREVMFNPQQGVLATQGRDATDVRHYSVEKMNEIGTRYASNIKDEKTRSAFMKAWSREADSNNDTAARHELKQFGIFQESVAKSGIETAVNDAYTNYNNPDSIKKAIGEARRIIAVNSRGVDDATLALQESKAVSAIHSAVITRLASKDPSKAVEYYETNSENIIGAHHVELTKTLAPAIKKQTVQSHVKRITSIGGGAASVAPHIQRFESNGNTNAESPKGASGLMQLMPPTAYEVAGEMGLDIFAHTDPNDEESIKALLKANPKLNVDMGTFYLQKQLDRFGNDLEVALIAYNAGPANAEKFLKAGRDYNALPKPSETKPYVRDVMNSYKADSGLTRDQTPRQEVQRGGLPAAGQKMTSENWTLKHFKPSDLVSPHEGGRWVDARAATMLDRTVDRFYQEYGIKLGVNAGHDFNSKKGLAAIGNRRGTRVAGDNPGVSNSRHLHGDAFDVQIQKLADEQKAAFLVMAREEGFTGIGFYTDKQGGHLHIDTGPERSWGQAQTWAAQGMNTNAVVNSAPPNTVIHNGNAMVNGDKVTVKTKTSNTVDWVNEAYKIEDPDIRDAVLGEIDNYTSAVTDALNFDDKQNKDAAWQHVMNGSVSDIPPELEAKLDATFMKGLMEYESKRNKAAQGEDVNDWNTWYEISRMPDDEFAKKDLMNEYRHLLDDKHFEKAIARQAELTKAQNDPNYQSKAISGLRTRTQMSTDAMQSLGLKGSDKPDAVKIAKFEDRLDQMIADHAVTTGKDMSPIEIQDLIDKMLLEDQDGMWGARQGRAFEAENINEFEAADELDDISDPDLEHLANRFKDLYHRTPSSAEAISFYNKGVQVMFGGTPEFDDNIEKERFKLTLENALGRPTEPSELRDYYGQWLLTFIR